MKLKDCPVGSVVIILKTTVPCTVLFHDPGDKVFRGGYSSVLVGWKTKNPSGWNRNAGHPTWIAQVPPEYVSASWAPQDMEATIVQTSTPTHTDGMSCAYCKDHNEYAQPNTPQGKYLCYSCRSNGHRAP